MSNFFLKIHRILVQIGLNLPRLMVSIASSPGYFWEYFLFKRGVHCPVGIYPCLSDRLDISSTTKNEYFWQDLYVARMIFRDCPVRHVDVGSRLDGFVAHVAAFRNIEVFDVRPMSSSIPGVIFRQVDLMDEKSASLWLEDESQVGCCDSLSCLHVLEHFGLGRYGDPIDPVGYRKGFANLARLLRPGGSFYLSTPMGVERVEFNANWIFSPQTILGLADSCCLELNSLVVFGGRHGFYEVPPASWSSVLIELGNLKYSLVLMKFVKRAEGAGFV